MSEQDEQHTGFAREQLFTGLYKSVFPAVARFISKHGGSFEQAKDIFHDALVIWYEKLRGEGAASAQVSGAYIVGIAKHLWYRRFSAGRNVQLMDSDFEDLKEEQPSASKLLAVLESSGQRCLDLLKSFYYDKSSTSELAGKFGFRSVRSATVQKYKCLEKVRETVKRKSLCYEDFLD